MTVAGDSPVSGADEAIRIPGLVSELISDTDVLAAAAEDFGHLVQRRPRGVLKPASTADIAAVVRWAAERGVPIAARGQGHSVYGRSQVAEGIVIDMSGFDTVHSLGTDHVIVDAGATWSAVLAATVPHGLTPPVLTDYLELSVGGTVSVGGIGGATHRHGMQSCNVVELDVVTGDGRELTCSADQHADLFTAVLAGLSQCGIITRATLRLVPAPEHTRRYVLHYRDLPAMTADQRQLLAEQRVDYLQGTILADGAGWKYLLEATVLTVPDSDDAVLAGLSDARDEAEIEDLSYMDFLNRLAPLESHLRSTGEWSHPHPWLNSFVRGSNAEEVVGAVLAELTSADLGDWGRVVLYPIHTGQLATPLLRVPDEDVVFLFNLLRFPPNDPEVVRRLVASNRQVYDRVRAAGGFGYPVSAIDLAPTEWADHFGPLWPRLRDAKERFDPRHILTPGQGVFTTVGNP